MALYFGDYIRVLHFGLVRGIYHSVALTTTCFYLFMQTFVLVKLCHISNIYAKYQASVIAIDKMIAL